MAIKIAANLKKEMLEDLAILRIGHGNTETHYSTVDVTPTYGTSGNQAHLEFTNVALPVESGTTVNNIRLFRGNGTAMASVTLEGSEIHEYSVNGTYTINNLRISF